MKHLQIWGISRLINGAIFLGWLEDKPFLLGFGLFSEASC